MNNPKYPTLHLYAFDKEIHTKRDPQPLKNIGFIQVIQQVNMDSMSPNQVLSKIEEFTKRYIKEKHVIILGSHGLKQKGKPRVINLRKGDIELMEIAPRANQQTLIIIDTCMSGHLGLKNQRCSWITASRGYTGQISHGYLTQMIASYLIRDQNWRPIPGNALPNWHFNKIWKHEFWNISYFLTRLEWTYNEDLIDQPYRFIED